jgi:hypothetical protein
MRATNPPRTSCEVRKSRGAGWLCLELKEIDFNHLSCNGYKKQIAPAKSTGAILRILFFYF